ncbi:MAG: hypothetical protein ACD_21C00258G0003 [uncultured bacterium]|nr:MAG: hypothetical protein ACD_21C00258G0003 [uncultured bacterium]
MKNKNWLSKLIFTTLICCASLCFSADALCQPDLVERALPGGYKVVVPRQEGFDGADVLAELTSLLGHIDSQDEYGEWLKNSDNHDKIYYSRGIFLWSLNRISEALDDFKHIPENYGCPCGFMVVVNGKETFVPLVIKNAPIPDLQLQEEATQTEDEPIACRTRARLAAAP